MIDDRALARDLRTWLRADGHESTAGILDDVLGQLVSHPQRRRRIAVPVMPGRLGRGPSSARALAVAVGLLVLALLTASVLPVAFPPRVDSTLPPTAQPTTDASLPTSPAPTSRPSATPGPTPTSTPAPTAARPSAGPTPAPTLDWETVGYAVGIRSPVVRGAFAFVTISAPAGPTCSIEVRYPGGTRAPTGSPIRRAGNRWEWSWFVPVTVSLGTATVDTVCTYQGLAKPGTGSFLIVDDGPLPTVPAPTPPPSAPAIWSISGDVASPVAAGGTLTFTGHVSGTPPAGNGPIDLHCSFWAEYPAGDVLIADDGFVNTRDFVLTGPVGSNPPLGSHGYRVTCQALSGEARTATGIFTIQ